MITCLWEGGFICPYDHCLGMKCPTFNKGANDQLTNTTATNNTSRYCMEKGVGCVFATSEGYCKLTACTRRTV